MLRYRIVNPVAKDLCLAVSALIAVTILSGCAALANLRADPPQNGKDPYALLDSKSAFNTERSDWKKPFWQRWSNPLTAGQSPPQPTPSNAGTGNNAGATTTVAAASPPVSTAATARTSAATTPKSMSEARADTLLRPQIGIYLDAASRDSKAAFQLVNALERHAAEYRMTVIKPGALTDSLSDPSTCAEPTSIGCRQTLAIYPGVRALLIIGVQPAGTSGQTRVATRMADTDFGVDYDAAITDVSLQDSDLTLWSRRVLDRTAQRLAIAPWFTHSFARQGDSVYISAGPRSGLATGTILAMHGEGSIVRAPSGSVVGWKPGPVVGRLKVKSPVGQGASLAQLISGQMPTPGDRLTVAKQENDTK